MYGTQTGPTCWKPCISFENDVKMYGTQTEENQQQFYTEFENDVKCMVLKLKS